MTKALITGSNGFVGRWLTEYLVSKNITVFGIDLQEQCPYPLITYCQADILDATSLPKLISDIKPDLIFNLAAVTFLPDADKSPKTAIDANISGVMILLDAMKEYVPNAQLLLIGSSREYPNTTFRESITEDIPVDPASFYGISKFISEIIGRQYYRQFRIDIRSTRSFNHTGPGQSPRFVCSEWTRRIAEIALGQAEPEITVGNMDVVIDFTDVRDVVKAYYSIITQGKPGEVYNVCSGNGFTLQWILDYLLCKLEKKITIHRLEEKFRSNESSVKMVGSYNKLYEHTGWTPSIPITQTLDDLYAWWLEQLQN